MCICNDRRWPETFRVMGLQGVEMVVLGYNTPTTNSQADEPPRLRSFHNELSMQAGAYQNSTWVVGVAKAGREDGHELMGGSAIVAPTGEIIAQAQTLADELVIAACDLDKCAFGKQSVFDFAAHRRIEHYGLITQQTGVVFPGFDEKKN
jgi:predicted amidohydrolase